MNFLGAKNEKINAVVSFDPETTDDSSLGVDMICNDENDDNVENVVNDDNDENDDNFHFF